LRRLGFCINWNKVVDPVQCITFMGIETDSVSMCKRLPQEQLARLREELQAFTKRNRASKKQLQSLAGKFNWAAGVVYGGRVFLRRILNAIRPLIAASHKCVRAVFPAVRIDIHWQWWERFMDSFNGSSLSVDTVPCTFVYTDACDIAAGGYSECDKDWVYCN